MLRLEQLHSLHRFHECVLIEGVLGSLNVDQVGHIRVETDSSVELLSQLSVALLALFLQLLDLLVLVAYK